MSYLAGNYDIAVIGAGHAGIEAALAGARMGLKTVIFAINLDNALNSLNMGMPQDIISVDLQLAIEAFGEIIGMTVSQEIVDRIFHNFCLGK